MPEILFGSTLLDKGFMAPRRVLGVVPVLNPEGSENGHAEAENASAYQSVESSSGVLERERGVLLQVPGHDAQHAIARCGRVILVKRVSRNRLDPARLVNQWTLLSMGTTKPRRQTRLVGHHW